MEEHHIRLRLNYKSLTDPESGFVSEHILDYLLKDNVFRADECEEVLAEKTTTRKAKCLLDFLLEKDVEAYNLFREGLKVNYPHFADDLDNTPLADIDRCRTQSTYVRARESLVDNSLRTTLTLPAMSTTLIGRIDERCRFLQWLTDEEDTSQRLYMFTGPPGIGKTILMVTVCHEYQLMLPLKSKSIPSEQMFYFDMNSYQNIEDLSTDMLISLQQAPLKHTPRQLCNLLRSLNEVYILIFDNAEDILSESLLRRFPEFLANILHSSTSVRVVLSSRVAIKSLTINSFEEKLKPLKEQDGISLTQNIVPTLTSKNALRLCKINGFLPLAICLTSILLQNIDDCEELLTALEQSPTMAVELLESIEGVPASSQLIRCFHSCFNKLNEQQQKALKAFSVFPSSFTRKAAEAVCGRGASDSSHTLLHTYKMLRTLEDRSMLMFDNEKQKYQIHPLLRSFCCTLVSSADRKIAEEDMCQYYLTFSQNCCLLFYQKECCRQAVQQFWSERQNVIHCFRLCISRLSLTRLTLPFATRNGLEFVRITIPDKLIKETYISLWNVLKPSELQEKLMVLTSLAFFARVVEGSPADAMQYMEEADRLKTKCVNLPITQHLYFLHTKAKTLAVVGRFEEAAKLADKSFEIAMSHNEEKEAFFLKGLSMETRAGVHRNNFIKSGLVQLAQQSNTEYDAVLKFIDLGIGDHIFSRYIHMSQGELRERIGDFPGALESYQKALSVQNVVMEDCIDHAVVQFLIGSVHERMGNLTKALQSLISAFNLSCKILGSSDKTKACGLKLIDVLTKLGDMDGVEAYKQRLSDINSTL